MSLQTVNHTQNDFKPAWWLKNSHLQTLYPALFRYPVSHGKVWRERLATVDDDFIDVDFCGQGDQPLILLLHGLTGSSKSTYILGLQQTLKQQGFRSAALNFRGCSGESNNTARCYHSGDTEDIHFLYQTLKQREPDTPMAAVGFSLGGNVLLKWLGEQSGEVGLFAACAVSVPLVLSVCATKMDSGFSRIYRDRLLRELKQYLIIKVQHLENIGNLQEAKKIRDLGDLSSIKSFWQYDDQVIARLYGFKDVHDYYQQSSARQFLHLITVPTQIIQARDDPFMTSAVLPQKGELSTQVTLQQTETGGHVGFITGSNPLNPLFWLEQRIPAFLKQQIKCIKSTPYAF